MIELSFVCSAGAMSVLKDGEGGRTSYNRSNRLQLREVPSQVAALLSSYFFRSTLKRPKPAGMECPPGVASCANSVASPPPPPPPEL